MVDNKLGRVRMAFRKIMFLPDGHRSCNNYYISHRFQRGLEQFARDRLKATFMKFKQHLKQAQLTKQLILYDLVMSLYISRKKTFQQWLRITQKQIHLQQCIYIEKSLTCCASALKATLGMVFMADKETKLNRKAAGERESKVSIIERK